MSSNVEQRLVQLQKEFCQLQEDSESVEREQTERIEELEMLVDSLKENEQKLKVRLLVALLADRLATGF